MNAPILETPRLILCPVALEDASAIQKYFGCWEIIQWLRKTATPWPYPSDGALQWLAEVILPEMMRNEAWAWGLRLKSGPNAAIGIVDVGFTDPEDNRGFWLGLPFQGRGLMTEAVATVHDYVFGTLDIARLVVRNARNNLASRRVKEKTTARFLRLEPAEYHNGCRESEIWEVRREDWRALRSKESSA